MSLRDISGLVCTEKPGYSKGNCALCGYAGCRQEARPTPKKGERYRQGATICGSCWEDGSIRKIRAAVRVAQGGESLGDQGARGGKMRTRAKAIAARENLRAARAARVGVAAKAAMSREEIEMMATLEPSNRAKARWIRLIAARGLTLTPEQAEILAREHEKKQWRNESAPPRRDI